MRFYPKKLIWSRFLAYFNHLPAEKCKADFYPKKPVLKRCHNAFEVVKHDWYDLDHVYVRNSPDCLFWRVLMPVPNPPAYFPFLSEDGLHHSLNFIREFYSEDTERDLNRFYPYLNEATMARYVADSTTVLLKIYDIFKKMPDISPTRTALSLLPRQEILPYDPPLGDNCHH